MIINVLKINDGKIIVVNCGSQYELASTFMRFQEYYESPHPELYRKFPDLEEFMDVCAKYYDNFTYTTDWNGFNMPYKILNEIIEKHSESFSRKEKLLINECQFALGDTNPDRAYVIGIHDDVDAFDHEVCHGLYLLDDQYRLEQDEITYSLPVEFFEKFKKVLLDMGYMEGVIFDEVQAYMSTSTLKHLEKEMFVNNLIDQATINRFMDVKDWYFNKYEIDY